MMDIYSGSFLLPYMDISLDIEYFDSTDVTRHLLLATIFE